MTTWPDVAMALVDKIGPGIGAVLTAIAVSKGLLSGNRRSREAIDSAMRTQLRERDARLAALEKRAGWKPRQAYTEANNDDTKP